MTSPIESSQMVAIGFIASTHGVRGDIKIRSFTTNPQDFANYRQFYNQSGEVLPLKIKQYTNKDIFIGHIQGIESPEDAALLKGSQIFIHKSQRPSLEEDEVYVSDLVGHEVYLNNTFIGTIQAYYDYGAGIFFDIALKTGKMATVPFNRDAILSIDHNEKCIHVDENYLLS
ncbi:MAG: ribosome maturation factor RimM [Alphaproteobacteria bacterium]|nr:ribosome maturation factor RimM [Alphaproteobacteria bacterium]